VTEWKPFWSPKSTDTVSVLNAKVHEPVVDRSAAGCCEFVGGLVDATCEGRYCFNGTFCPARCFKDSKVFAGCSLRLDKLKSKEQS